MKWKTLEHNGILFPPKYNYQEISIKINGKKIRLTIPPGTQSETQFRFKGKGMTILRQNHRGDMYVTVGVEIPVNLTSQQRSILKEFENEGGTSKAHSPKSQSFFKKLKEVWEELI